uniref:Uncharacterized protein n=1 Tax=Physcomitrium patens TaxID=3218 RepID=A0A2K1J0Q7_PHYPA|nr:hypothetical protein PHYPA_023011 [Physcomitrium patens]
MEDITCMCVKSVWSFVARSADSCAFCCHMPSPHSDVHDAKLTLLQAPHCCAQSETADRRRRWSGRGLDTGERGTG